jgi:ferric-dicitrate binding protein FerR (iron transport regulator)
MKEDPSHLSPEEHFKAERIAWLVAGFLRQTLSPEEQDELDSWVAESDHNVQLFEELIDEKTYHLIPKRPWSRRFFPWAMAASVLGIIGTIYFVKRKPEMESISQVVKIPEIVLATARGIQYQMNLPDGTRVWLNAQSFLSYPASFPGVKRTVELKGEAFFEVAKNKNQPFDVKAGGADIQATGTEFDVNAYEDEKVVTTTLLEGSVKIITQNNTVLLNPNEKGIWNKNGKINLVRNINPNESTAWKSGMFSFQQEDIYSVMRQLARWYNVDIRYNGTILQNHFTARLERSLPLSKVLKLLEGTGGVHFSIQDKTIMVSP